MPNKCTHTYTCICRFVSKVVWQGLLCTWRRRLLEMACRKSAHTGTCALIASDVAFITLQKINSVLALLEALSARYIHTQRYISKTAWNNLLYTWQGTNFLTCCAERVQTHAYVYMITYTYTKRRDKTFFAHGVTKTSLNGVPKKCTHLYIYMCICIHIWIQSGVS